MFPLDNNQIQSFETHKGLEWMSWYGEKGNRVDSTGEGTLNILRRKYEEWIDQRQLVKGVDLADFLKKTESENNWKIISRKSETNAHQNINY